MRRGLTLAALALAALALAACHHHRDVNAPGVIDPLAPPRDLTSGQLEYPGDPGEKMLVVTAGPIAGVGGGSTRDGVLIDLGAEVTVSLGESDHTHNDRASRLFLPRGVVLPPRADGLTLGWSGLRIVARDGSNEKLAGALYAQVQRSWLFYGVAAGLAVEPGTGALGPQVDAFYTFYFLRARVLFDEGWELGGGMYLKLPSTWVWSR